MKLTFISFLFIHLIRMIVCYFTFSSFFLWLIGRKARLIDGRSKLLKLDEFLSLFYFWLIDWNQFSFFFHHWMNEWMKSTDDNGYLGSCIDEERSKVRKAMWIAQHVNHQIFERIWRLGSCFQACLFESRFHKLQSNYLFSFHFISVCFIGRRLP